MTDKDQKKHDLLNRAVADAERQGEAKGKEICGEFIKRGFPAHIAEIIAQTNTSIIVNYAKANAALSEDSAKEKNDIAAHFETKLLRLQTSVVEDAAQSRSGELASEDRPIHVDLIFHMQEVEEALQACGLRPWIDYGPMDLIGPASRLFASTMSAKKNA